MKKTKLLPILWVIALCSLNLVAQSSASDKGGPAMHEARFKVFDSSTKTPIALAALFDPANKELGKTDMKGSLVVNLPASTSDVYQVRYPGFSSMPVRLTQADKKTGVYDVFLQPIGTSADEPFEETSTAPASVKTGGETELVKVYVKQEPSEYKKNAPSQDQGRVEFAVQLSATSRPISDKNSLKSWEELGPVFIHKEAGLYKVRIGPYNTQEAAKQVLLQAKSRGKKDAFIVVQEGIENHIPFEFRDPAKGATAPVMAEKNDAVKTEPIPGEMQGDYKVRLASYLHPGGFNTKEIDQYGTLESYRKGEWTIMMIGGFKTAKEAKRVREIVVGKGYPDAAVVVERDGLLEEVE
jgi:cell division septation protein DedD